jgi:hypothetical protein
MFNNYMDFDKYADIKEILIMYASFMNYMK